MTNNQLPTAGKDGVRSYEGQKPLDEMGTILFKSWFEKVFKTTVRTTNKVVQLRGVDLAVNLPGRSGSAGPVGTDLKIDTYLSGNISFELISQCRGNSKRSHPAVGWTGKDMPWVTYCFIQTGEVVFLDMAQVTPWLQDLVSRALEGQPPGTPEFDYWVSATPNATYQSYNVMAKISAVLAHCPGAYYLRLMDTLSPEAFAGFTGAAPKPPLVVSPAAAQCVTPEQLQALMRLSGCYHIKPQLSEDDTEALIRWCEQHAKYSTKSGVREKGAGLTASRVRRALACDPVAQLAA